MSDPGEACRIIITEELTGLMNVSAPMKYKELCNDILDDALFIVLREPKETFFAPGKSMVITMNMSGMVDLQAPLPDRAWCEKAIKESKQIIKEYQATGNKFNQTGFADNLNNAHPIS